MVRINHQEQLMRLLAAKLKGDGKVGKASPVQRRAVGPMARVRTLIATGALTDEEAGRLLLEGILAEQFGPRVASDPAFRAIIDEVHAQVRADAASRALLDASLREISAPPKAP